MLEKAPSAAVADRQDTDDGQEHEYVAPDKPWPGLLDYFKPRSLTARIVLLNLFALAILVTGILYFNQARQSLIQARIQSLTTQAQIISAAIAGAATIDTGNIVINPDDIDESNDYVSPDADQMGNLEFPINPETTGPVLKRLLANSTVRGRIIDPDGNLIIGLVLVTHGQLAEEFVGASVHVVGPQANMDAICIAAEDDMEARPHTSSRRSRAARRATASSCSPTCSAARRPTSPSR